MKALMPNSPSGCLTSGGLPAKATCNCPPAARLPSTRRIDHSRIGVRLRMSAVSSCCPARAPAGTSPRCVQARLSAAAQSRVLSRAECSMLANTSTSTPAGQRVVTCRAEGSGAQKAAQASGTPVPRTALLVVGGTGTLGRQIVRRALDEGYDVRCIVRPRENPADFLRDWGAKTIQADLTDPASLPATLVGIHTVIDASTARPEQSVQQVDWEGKVALIQSAQAMGIQRYIFFSVHDCDKHPDVPLMNIKSCTEKFLAESGLNYTVFRLCGLMQGLIGNYAVPILEERPVWGTSDQTRTAYLDSLDIAKMTMAALQRDQTIGKVMTLSGPKAYTVQEIIEMCENLAGARASVNKVPTALLNATRAALSGFAWARDAADRLAFAEVLSGEKNISADMREAYELLGMDESQVTTVEEYLKQYFDRILKKLKEVGAESKQTNFYV